MIRKTLNILIILMLLAGAWPVRAQDGDDDALTAALDGKVTVAGLLHDSRAPRYRTPGGAQPTSTDVKIRLRTYADDVTGVILRVYNTRRAEQTLIPMEIVSREPGDPLDYAYWEATASYTRPTVLWYRFIVRDGDDVVFYEDDTRDTEGAYFAFNEGGPGTTYTVSPDLSWQLSLYEPGFETPEWVHEAVIYQIFPDRFRNGSSQNDPEDGETVFYDEMPIQFHETWNEPPTDPRTDPEADWGVDFFGGDLTGIAHKLDYLSELGVNTLYLNPIFEARSNHRYDTADYLAVDPYLGTLDDFKLLMQFAERKGFRVVLDAVFNHMSSDSPKFDRYERYEETGACEAVDSDYRYWFYFRQPTALEPEGVCVDDGSGATFYESWAGFDSIPKLNSTNPDVRRYFFLDDEESVAAYWAALGISGWRMDVGGDIDNGVDPNNNYWEKFREAVKEYDPEALIIGEEWEDGAEWLLGDEWDSVMNYRLRMALIGFASADGWTDNDSNGDRAIRALSPAQFDAQFKALWEDYPEPASLAMLNLLGSHDTNRLAFVLDDSAARQQLAALLQFALPGAPTIYYGDEVALYAEGFGEEGGTQDDPYNRAPFPWEDTPGTYEADEEMLAFYQTLGRARTNYDVLALGDFVTVRADEDRGLYAFARRLPESGEWALIVLNNGSESVEASLDVSGILPPDLELVNIFEGEKNIVSSIGAFEVAMPALSGTIYVNDEQITLTPLEAPTGLTAESGSDEVALNWEPVEGAAAYVIYRGPVAGGYDRIGFVLEPAFTDTGVLNGYRYHYAVTAVDEYVIESALSEDAEAVPAAPIAEIGSFSELPEEVTLGAETVLNLEAWLRVPGITDSEGRGEGVRAEFGFGHVGQDIRDWVNWFPMAYKGDDEDADVYQVNFQPEHAGIFAYSVRFSTNLGEEWTYLGEGGTLTVKATRDEASPPTPAGLSVEQPTLSSLVISWEPVIAGDLWRYEIYRQEGKRDEPVRAGIVPAGQTAFTDTGVQEGGTYLYTIIATDTNFNKSDPSEPIEGTVRRRMVDVTFIVTAPDYTPKDSEMYIAGELGEGFPLWDPAGLPMEYLGDFQWQTTLQIEEGTKIEYKFVRGNWERVEKGTSCEEIANRIAIIDYGADGAMLLDDHVVAKWRDLDNCG